MLTVILVAAVYCLSVLPIFSYHIAVPLIISGEDLKSKPFFGTTYYRAASSFVTLNTISNFYIYSLTVPSFREFVWATIRLRSNRISSQSHVTSNNVTSHDRNVTSHDRNVTSHDRNVMSHDRNVTSHDRNVTSHDRNVTSHDRNVTSHDRNVTSHDRNVTSHDRNVTSHDRNVTSHDRNVTSHDRNVMSHDRNVMSHDVEQNMGEK